MESFFYPDPNHENPEHIESFCEKLPELRHKGVEVVFLEFLYALVPPKTTN
jgi:hypothetical protein